MLEWSQDASRLGDRNRPRLGATASAQAVVDDFSGGGLDASRSCVLPAGKALSPAQFRHG